MRLIHQITMIMYLSLLIHVTVIIKALDASLTHSEMNPLAFHHC